MRLYPHHHRLFIVGLYVGLMGITACNDRSDSTSTDNEDTGVSMDTAEATDSAGGSDTATPTDTRMTADGETDTEGPDGVVLNTPEEAFAAVDPLIGTGGEGYSYAAMTPAAQVPLGMVRVGPDSTNAGSHWAGLHHASGYWYNDPDVRGFSHTHFVGTGVADYGHHRVMALREEDLERFEPGTAWASKDTAWERGEPGYYTTRLVEPEVEVELAATLRTGVHRYTPRGEPERPMMVLFDAGSTVRDDGVEEASIRVEGGRIEGEVLYTRGYSTRSRPYRVYMAAVIEPEPLEVWSWDETGYRPGETEVSGSEKAGLVMRFAGDGPVVVKVGLSFIDRAGAWANLEAEAMPYTFDEVRAQAAADWMEVLGQVEVAGGEPKDHRVLFTALYNAYRMPTRLDEVDGRYRGLDGDVHTVEEGSAYYTDLSLWDTFRTVHPWYTLVSPDVQRDCLRSLLRMAQQGDRGMPRWPAALSYTQGMIGRSADVLFGESALKGIEGVDYAAAADILLGEAFPGPNSDPQAIDRELLESYDTFGYVPQDRHDQSVSETLEHSYHDWALAHLAASQGLPEAERLAERSKSYTALFDAEAGFFRPRLSDGRFEENARFDPTNHYERSGPYTEGSAWHWLFYVPHDPEGLMALMGGRETMLERLETFMTASKFRSREALDRILPDSYYWHANQPSLHVVYLFAQLGAMERFSYWAREVQRAAYSDTPDGLAGNDDGGTLSAWYLFSALGVFPIAGGDRYTISPPLFTYARVHLGNGQVLTVEAPEASAELYTIREVTLDGTPLDLSQPMLDHATLMQGPTLTFTLD